MSLSQMHLEQYQKLKVLVLDDDRMSAHNLSIQLKFLGETPLLSNSENWLQVLRMLTDRGESSNLLAVALGQIRKCNLVDLLMSLNRHSPHLPLLLLGDLDDAQLNQLPESLQEKLLPLGDASLNYQHLLGGLQKARRLSGRMTDTVPTQLGLGGGGLLFRSLCGQSPEIQRIRQLFQVIGKRQVTVLLSGESGTGKEVVARNLHYYSGRSDRPFIAVNCAGIASDRQGAELFGQQRNLNGLRADVSGLIEQAEGGTLFLDEIGELPLQVQALLLRFLEDRTFQRVGGHEYQLSDVRIVAATRQDLEQRIDKGFFREDLFYRLAVMPIELPPLRERREDIPDLVRELCTALEQREQLSVRFSSVALRSLQQHRWPGNVRELANLIERLGIMLPNTVIGLNELPQAYRYEVEAREDDDIELDISDNAGLSLSELPPFEELASLGIVTDANEVALTDGPVDGAPLTSGADSGRPFDPATSAERIAGRDQTHIGHGECAADLAEEAPSVAEQVTAESASVAAAAESVRSETESTPTNDAGDSAAMRGATAAFDAAPDEAVVPPAVVAASALAPSGASADNSVAVPPASTANPFAYKVATPKAPNAGVPAALANEYMQPLDEERLQAYLKQFERQLLEVALHDSAGFLDYAAGRLSIDDRALRGRMAEHGLVETA